MKIILKKQWDELIIQLDSLVSYELNYSFSEITFEILFQNYFHDENRYYHNANHIRSCLENLDYLIKHYRKNKKYNEVSWLAIKLAIWFHDFIYDTHKNNNEELSSLAAKQFILGMVDNIKLAEDVGSLILFTKHNREALTIEEKIFSDIDLYVLGDYGYHELLEDGYVDKIRKEYIWVPDFIYYPSRLKIIEGFLNREKIFYNDLFFNQFEFDLERQAKENISKEVDLIKKRLININGKA